MRRVVLIVAALATALILSVTVHAIIVHWRNQQTKDCVENLRQIDGAKQQWALENDASENAEPSWPDLWAYSGRNHDWPPHCPSGGFYVIGRVGEAPRCSFVQHTAACWPDATIPIASLDNGLHQPLKTTPAYEREMVRLMIAEAK